MPARLIRVIRVAYWLFSVAILLRAVALLAQNPNNDELAVLPCFIPPLFACLFLVADTGKFNRTVVLGCELFLGIIAVAILLGEEPFLLPNLKPQFPGMPRQLDRILCFYLAAYGLFLWIICPAYVFGSSLYRYYRGIPAGMSRPILYCGLFCWLLTMAVLAYALVTSDKFF